MKRAWVRWRDLDSHWQSLSGWFNPTVTRLFISWFALTPIFIKIAGELPETITISGVGDTPMMLTLALPFSWAALWFASLAYAISFVIYVLKCPKFIKDYRNYDAFEQRGHSPRWLVWEFYYAWTAITANEKKKLLERTSAKKIVLSETSKPCAAKPSVDGDATHFVFEHGGSRYRIALNESVEEKIQRELFWELFGRWSAAHNHWRNVSWLFLAAAFLIVGFIVIQNIFFVLMFLFWQ